MARFLLARLVQFPLILGVIYLTTFALVWLAPGDPFAMLNERNNPEAADQLRRQFNADSPWTFLTTYPIKLLSGEMGPSFKYQGMQVGEIIGDALPVSLAIGALAVMFATGVGVFVGTLAAVRRGGVLDWASLTLALVGVSVPSFVVAAGLMTAFAYKLDLMPLGGWPGVEGRGYANPAAYVEPGPGQIDPETGDVTLTFPQRLVALAAATGDYLWHMILPAIALSLLPMAYITRLTRVSMIDVLGSEFVRTARAKGLSRFKVVFKHCLRNAILPVLSFLGPATANVLVGSFVVETIFVIPGLGPHFVASVQSRDQPLILGTVMIYSLFLLTLNLLVDVAYTIVDPRIELAGTTGKGGLK
jgi:oligopeptide transport system permease protein